MRVLHVVKTADGAKWAALQAAELTRLGADVHVALPTANGNTIRDWVEARATMHIVPLDYPVRSPWLLPSVCAHAREIVDTVQPDIIHCHHVGPALLMRQALGKSHPTPRIFQVPGPLHLEHWLYRKWDLASAGPNDRWIASSRCIQQHYLQAGVPRSKVFLSYYGFRPAGFSVTRTHVLRERLGIPRDAIVVGNISYIYAPKYYLGQRVGLKCHEDLIEALSRVIRVRRDAIGVLVGGPWGNAHEYARKLQRRAESVGKGRILMPGYLPFAAVRDAWPDFDCAIHVPLSENCGGVVEPLLAGVPTIAATVGGLPEVVVDGLTGVCVPPRDPGALSDAILEVLGNIERYRAMARSGRQLVAEMFDVRRTGEEVHRVYQHILSSNPEWGPEFDSRQFLTAEAAA